MCFLSPLGWLHKPHFFVRLLRDLIKMHTSSFADPRDLVVHLPELLERALAVTPDSSSHFRVLDLPADLLECLALYFEGKEGVRVLTVSSAFHDVFARSVWRVLSRKAIDVAEPTRSEAYARYGHLVRKIDLERCLYMAFDLHNWLELFPNTTVFGTDIQEDMSVEQKQLTFAAISGLHGLRIIELYMGSNQSPFDLDTLATLLVARNQSSTMQPVRQIKLWFSATDHSEPWAAVHLFVETVAVLSLESLRIEMSLCSEIPITPAQFTAVRQYLTGMPYKGIYESDIHCFDEHNRNFFGMDEVSSAQPMCPLLTYLNVNVCCASSDIYDYEDITPANFPQLQSLAVVAHVCTNHVDGNENAAVQKILNQHWPSVTDMGLHDTLNSSIVDAVFLYNSHLTSITITVGRGMADESGAFLIERVLEQFPKLSYLSLRCTDNVKLDTQWIDYNDWESIRTSELQDLDAECTTITPQILELTLMLPKLVRVQLISCAVGNESAAIVMLKQVHEEKTARNGDTDGGDVDGRYPCSMTSLDISNFCANAPFWSYELIVAFVAVMSQLTTISLRGYSDDTAIAVKERFQTLKLITKRNHII
ncbi:hypothetical protein GQ42DRAFT_21485 [Ramicandelaber brevisporus]|nr:hypothetical protein GQ42DRAFT_21485 [Ramicandelaber brevisporus]